MSTSEVIQIPLSSTYGAVEIKEFIKKNTIKGFIITISILLLLLLLFFIFTKIQEAASAGPKLAPVVKITLDQLPPPASQEEAPPPPAQTIINTGPAARAGTPVPVPDAMVKPDMQDFATVDVQSRASAEGGTGDDQGGFAPGIDFNAKVDVRVREEEPAPDAFIPVEKEPQIDLPELQKRVEYPEMARRAGIEGRVIIRVLVGKKGEPKKTIIEYTDSDMLNKSAQKAVMASVFTPAIQNGQPITCWVSIPIVFKLR